ncbi:hypothetical protein BT96DRAFT_955168 [Gymnopus androsaceus JB14]|uniref:Uncharacterized protein n=1 Tax=Gymnopus androsaceus JB14 TaxID=1447944 RepID=A0A6A4I591_9AGAR|nr:hypothetical protein BT96DRAFT_955168 [Gymnopus androsaceus JB14]
MEEKLQLSSLPIELLYEIQLYALSHSLPHTSRHFYQIFKDAPPSFQAEYIFRRSLDRPESLYLKALRYPSCSLEVLQFIKRYAEKHAIAPIYSELPKRLFRDLTPRKDGSHWSDRDHPLPFIRGIYTTGISPDVNTSSGYALTKAVQSGFIPLVQLLLEKGALPAHKDNLTVRVAIRQKNLQMVRQLIERTDRVDHGPSKEKRKLEIERTDSVDHGPSKKRRKLEDRVTVTKEMLKLAVKCNAQDIVDYFTKEKGCVPDLQTLYLMH